MDDYEEYQGQTLRMYGDMKRSDFLKHVDHDYARVVGMNHERWDGDPTRVCFLFHSLYYVEKD